MPNFVYVSEANLPWLKKALEFIKKNQTGIVSGTVSAVTGYLLQHGIPHGHANKKEEIPAGHHYHGS